MEEKYLTRIIRTTLFVVFICQLVSSVERQVFDFLGYMWAPIIGNFLQIIAVILGLFGVFQHYRSFIVVYVVWSILWLGWNIFVICLYMEVGTMTREHERYILTLGTESKSWWLEHGAGCKVTNDSWEVSPQKAAKSSRPIPPEEFVEGCVLQYYYVEVIHAAVQIVLVLAGLVLACVILHTMMDEEDASSPANDELEFVKIRSRAASTTPQRSTTTTTTNFDNLAFDSDDNDSLRRAYRLPPPGGPRPYEQPPSYDVTMKNTSTEAETRAANMYYASDRQSVRSKASTRSKRSTAAASGYHRGGNQASSRSRRSTRSRGRDRDQAAPQDLPWVQITPSTSGSVMDGHSRHYTSGI